MTISRMGISSLMGYQDGGGVEKQTEQEIYQTQMFKT